MPIRTIAVAVTSAREAEWLIDAAAQFAIRFEAHLTVVRPIQGVVPYIGGDIAFDPVLAPEFLDWQLDESAAIRAIFDRATAGLAAELRSQESVTAGAERFLLDGVRAADLVMAGRIDRPAGGSEAARLKEQLVRQAGRPVLMTPRSQQLAGPVEHLLIGWSQTREATRAAHDALALAAPGARIDLLTVDGPTSIDLEFDARQDLAAAFDRLGFRTELVDRQAAAGDAGEVLLRTAFERGADLVATGAFGHSRVYDFVIGAVTSHLAEKAEMPVLLSK